MPNPAFRPILEDEMLPFVVHNLDFDLHARATEAFTTSSTLHPVDQQQSPFRPNAQTFSTISRVLHENHLVVIDSDKNLGPVVMNKQDYIDAVEALLHTPDYRPFDDDNEAKDFKDTIVRGYSRLIQYTFTVEQQDQPAVFRSLKFLRSLADEYHIPYFYGLPKIHKGIYPPPLRPIAASHSWLTQPLASYFSILLGPFVRSLNTVLKDSRQLIQELNTLQLDSEPILVTADVVSLYPSIDVDDLMHTFRRYNVWERATQLARVHHSEKVLPIPSPLKLQALLRFLLSNHLVSFNGRTYLQIQGIAMGVSCAVEISNIYMYYQEEQFLADLPAKSFYRRLVDDVFIVWTGTLDTLTVWRDRVNTNTHPNIRFTWHIAGGPCPVIDFLDLTISFRGPAVFIRTFQKPFNKFLYVPFQSSHPTHVKRSWIYTELLRYSRSNTRYIDFLTICFAFYRRLRTSGYPPWFLDPIFANLSRLFLRSSSLPANPNPNPMQPVPRPPLRFILPYFSDFARVPLSSTLTGVLSEYRARFAETGHPAPYRAQLAWSNTRSASSRLREKIE